MVENSIKTLVIGCGRMGTGTGSRSHRLTSHAGVLSELDAYEVFVVDQDLKIARQAASTLGLEILEKIEKKSLEAFDCAVVCTPTKDHFKKLLQLMECQIPLIICEKPVCSNIKELRSLETTRRNFQGRILVNYTRRFLPSYVRLKKQFSRLLQVESLKCCAIRYQRGFLNNASHALDLTQFLTGWDIAKARVEISHRSSDEFPDDPTATGVGKWNGALLSFLGLPDVKFSLFEIDFFFERSAIRLRDRGDTIEIARSAKPADYYAPLVTQKTACENLEEPLSHLYRHVQKMFRDPKIPDNFDESLKLTEWIFRTLNKSRA